MLNSPQAGLTRAQADHATFHIMIALMQEDLPTATEWGKRLAPNIDAVPFYINLIPARLLIAQGEKSRAAESCGHHMRRRREADGNPTLSGCACTRPWPQTMRIGFGFPG